MAIGDILRRGGDMMDSAAKATAERAAALKSKASNLTGDEKDEVVYDGALSAVADAMIEANIMTPEVNALLKQLKDANPYRD